MNQDEGKYASFSFVCDTVACLHLFLGDLSMALLQRHGRVQQDGAGNYFAKVCGHLVSVYQIPRLIVRKGSFQFEHKIDFF